MSQIRLFQNTNKDVDAIEGQFMAVEQSLQTRIEKHREVFLGLR